uniref:Ovule protein n=1 Tax=Romanomermis culicivorax TaxID=13658 RepID=A0A915HTB3_ROMCU
QHLRKKRCCGARSVINSTGRRILYLQFDWSKIKVHSFLTERAVLAVLSLDFELQINSYSILNIIFSINRRVYNRSSGIQFLVELLDV